MKEQFTPFAHGDLREFQPTSDGSFTLYSNRFQETYHSRHGARTESDHIFIRNGLDWALEKFSGPIRIFEVGFGTGLNAYLAALRAFEEKRQVSYLGFEQFPLDENQRSAWLAYPWEDPDLATEIGTALPDQIKLIRDYFQFEWSTKSWPGQAIGLDEFELVFYDAFAPGSQPELWTSECFHRAFEMLVPGGILVTYCAKGYVKRNLKEAGFEVWALPGPPGKREMTRAVRPR